MTNPELPDHLTGAKIMLEDHNYQKRRVVHAPVERLEGDGKTIIHRICGPDGPDSRYPGKSGP